MDEHAQNVKKIAELIKDIRVAMMTTVEPDGSLRSRPMATLQVEFDGDLWFFTQSSAAKTGEILRDHHVNLAYQDTDDRNLYVSISGRADLVHDAGKIRELWNPLLKAWFPKGLDDPDLALIRVRAEKAEYWDSSTSPIVYMLALAKSVVKGERPKVGDHETVEMA